MCRKQVEQAILFGVLLGLVGCAGVPTPPPVPATPDFAQVLEAAAKAETSVVNVSPPAPCCPRQTLPQFLGVHQACGGLLGIIDRIRNRLGMMFPGLEAKPPLLAITDPANLESTNPAVAGAAAVKQQEDMAAQKIKAIRYLATVGCLGCYPEVEKAFLAALDDCTEAVRFEAAKAIRETADGNAECCFCCAKCCCSKKIQEKLMDLAYGKDEVCCDKEPSARVRRMARLALCSCCPPVEPYKEPTKADAAEVGPQDTGSTGPQDTAADGGDDATTPPTPPTPPADSLPPPPPPATDADKTTLPARRLPAVGPAPILSPATGPVYEANFEPAAAVFTSDFAR